MQLIPKTAIDALAIYLDPASEDWVRDYSAKMIGGLEEGREALLATARDPQADGMLQQRAAECLSYAWRDQGVLMTADISGFAPAALQEILFQRGEGAPYRGGEP
jgi:hypothetical protein